MLQNSSDNNYLNMGPLGLSPAHVGEALKTGLRIKNTKQMEKSLGSKGSGFFSRTRNGTVNVWDRLGHSGHFLQSVNLRPYFLGGLLSKVRGQKSYLQVPFHLCGLKN